MDYTNLETMKTALNQIFDGPGKNPTILICADDLLAYKAIQVLREMKIKVPDEVSVTGFDGIQPYYAFDSDNAIFLTTVVVDLLTLGRTSLSRLVDLATGKPSSPVHMRLPVKLQVGDSVRRLK